MTLLDRMLATDSERHEAAARMAEALRLHGDEALDHLVAKLADPRRRRSRRPIRLAIEALRARH